MDLNLYKLKPLLKEVEDYLEKLNLLQIREQIAILEIETQEDGFWNDISKAEVTLKKIKVLKDKIVPWGDIKKEILNLLDLVQFLEQEEDKDLEEELKEGYNKTLMEYESLKLKSLLNGKWDAYDVFFSIHAGAGGTESCDWVNMLYRMYTRYFDEKGYAYTVIDFLEAEGGLKSITLEVKGINLYGMIKSEIGIHRLVRISPFDSSGKRHTTFASVYASPILEEDSIIEILPQDLKIDTFRAQGAGGQHVNTTDSAIRITHLPTKIVVQCQNERSQHSNKATALKILKSKLYDLQERDKKEEQSKQEASKQDISFGSQIRSYVFHPYSMVKDLRTRYESSNIQGIMDGKLDSFIEAFLKWNM